MAQGYNLSIDTDAASQSQIITQFEEDDSGQVSPVTDEDIEPGLVYALRTFTETVEGRAK
ncbi:21092_t:CDS:1, partial [Racocetra persica]